MEKVANFVKSHSGFYVEHNERGVTLQIECVDRAGDRWTEFQTVWSIRGARQALGY